MRLTILVFFMSILFLSSKAQSKFFVANANFLNELSEPELNVENRSFQVRLVIDGKFSNDDIYKDSINIGGIDAKVFQKSGATSFTTLAPSISMDENGKYINLIYKIQPALSNIETDWSKIEYKWNVSYAGQKMHYPAYTCSNAKYNKGILPKVVQFYKSSASDVKNVNVSLSSDAPIEITRIAILNEEDSRYGEATGGAIVKTDDKTFKALISPLSDFNFTIGKGYKLQVSYKSKGGAAVSNVTFENQKLDGIEDFKILDVTGKQVVDNAPGSINVQTSAEAENLVLLMEGIDGQPIVPIVGIKTNNVNYKFPIKSDEATFPYGIYKVSFSGSSKLTGAALSSSTYTFEKKKPVLLKITPKNKKDTFSITALFDTSFSVINVKPVKLRIEKNEFVMESSDNKLFAIDFTMKDLILKKTLSSITKDKQFMEIMVLYPGNSKSTIIELPITILDNVKLEQLAQADKSKKKRKEDIEAYLNSKDFTGDTEKIAASMLEEFGKTQDNRDWDKVWDSVVKLAPKVLGALTLLL